MNKNEIEEQVKVDMRFEAHQKECPYCKGTSGYYTKCIRSSNVIYDWGNNAVDDIITKFIRGGKIKRCLDCNRIIR